MDRRARGTREETRKRGAGKRVCRSLARFRAACFAREIGMESLLAGYDKLSNSTISGFIATQVSDQLVSSPAAVSDTSDPVRVILPFKDQSSADIVRRQLPDLSHKIYNL